MKLAALAIAILGIAPAAASAATCGSLALGTVTTANEATTITGNTCTDTNNAAVATACSVSLNGSGEAVYGITLGTNAANVVITATSTGSGTSGACAGTSTCQFWPGIYLLSITVANTNNSCGGQACANGNTVQQNDTTPAVLNVQTGSLALGRTFFFIVGDSNGVTAGDGFCGPYSIAVTGSLPVKLENFSVD